MALSSTDRMSLFRERRKNGPRCIQVEIRDAEVDELVRRGFLSAADRHIRALIRDALYSFLAQYLRPTGFDR